MGETVRKRTGGPASANAGAKTGEGVHRRAGDAVSKGAYRRSGDEAAAAARRRNALRWTRRGVDTLLAVLLLAVMATPVMYAQVHEWAGVALVVLVVAHVALDVRRWAALVRRRSVLSAAFLLVEFALAVAILAMAASAVVLSEYAFSWLPALPGVAWARSVHAAASGWLFVLAFLHAGTHVRGIPSRFAHGKGARKAACVAAVFVVLAACAAAGAVVLVRLGMWESMTLQTAFAAIDPSTPAALVVGAYAVVALGSAACGCGVAFARQCIPRRRTGTEA